MAGGRFVGKMVLPPATAYEAPSADPDGRDAKPSFPNSSAWDEGNSPSNVHPVIPVVRGEPTGMTPRVGDGVVGTEMPAVSDFVLLDTSFAKLGGHNVVLPPPDISAIKVIIAEAIARSLRAEAESVLEKVRALQQGSHSAPQVVSALSGDAEGTG